MDKEHSSYKPIAGFCTKSEGSLELIQNSCRILLFYMKTDILLSEIAEHIQWLFESNKHDHLLYHNLDHTKLVVLHATEIAGYYKLQDPSLFILLSAAWFHDTGQLSGDINVHEETSVQFMKDFFAGKAIDKNMKEAIARCILATKMPVSPASQLEEIICDADTYHLGTEDFHRLDKLVWQELELRMNKAIDNQEEKSLHFLKGHQFFTGYCLHLLTAGKEKNIKILQRLLSQTGI